MRRARLALAVLALALPLALGACGDSDAPADTGSGQETKTIDITVDGDTVTPNGDRVEVGVGQPIELVVKADEAGEIHVHSDPEQELEYAAGTTTLTLSIDKPGIVDGRVARARQDDRPARGRVAVRAAPCRHRLDWAGLRPRHRRVQGPADPARARRSPAPWPR